jgi:hypothetical protein
LRTQQHTLVLDREGGTEQCVLYDRAEDPHQLRNVADEQPGVVRDLRVELEEWLQRTGDPWLDPLTGPSALGEER